MRAEIYSSFYGPRAPLRKTDIIEWNKHPILVKAGVPVRASDWLRELLSMGTGALQLPPQDEKPSGLLLLS